MKIGRIILLSCFMMLAGMPARAQNQKDLIPLKHGAHSPGGRKDAAMERWRDYGLGQFIHWGVYAIPGGTWGDKTYTGAAEWIRSWREIPNAVYDNLYKEFNPIHFDAKVWAKMAREMGAKYMIFTTKHHDGFCMWPSKFTDYTIEHTPFKRDIVRELVDAYSAEGIDVYLYFSIIDWSHPGYVSGGNINDPEVRRSFRSDPDYNPFRSKEEEERYEDFKVFTRNQLLELLDNYSEIKGLWFDGSWDVSWVKNAAWVDTLGQELREKHPGLIIGSRFRSDELGNRHVDANGHLIDDYDQRYERNLPKNFEETRGFDWDCVMTIPENQWGYHKDWSLTYVKTAYELIEMLVRVNSMNGNMVINFGPDGEGKIRSEETRIAREIGRWMGRNGDAVYGVRRSVLQEQDWGYATQKGEKVYLTVFRHPLNNQLRIKIPVTGKRETIYFITGAKELTGGKTIRLKGSGKAGTYYRDKTGAVYYDLMLPKKMRKSDQPYVIEIELKEIQRAEMEQYQQALT